MAKKIIIDSIKLKAGSATLDLEELYKRMWRWFEMMGYVPKETEYSEATDASGAQTLEIRWDCSKEIDSTLKQIIIVDFFLVGIKEVEVDKGGVKTKLMKGTFEMNISGVFDRAAGYDSTFLKMVKMTA